jgi:hypothetical protein
MHEMQKGFRIPGFWKREGCNMPGLQQQEGKAQHVCMQLQERRQLFIFRRVIRVFKLRRRDLQHLPLSPSIHKFGKEFIYSGLNAE